ncbi:MAG: GTPase ObgE, partial [Rikenellaceae bacterium]
DKNRVLAITKSDMLDQELTDELSAEINASHIDIPYVFISSVTLYNLQELKDKLWASLH